MSLPPVSAYNVRVIANAETAEYGKFIQLTDSTSFPPVSVTKFFYPDNSQAYIPSDVKLGTLPGGVPPITSVDIYPKFATLNYVVNATDFPSPTINLSAGTVNISTSALTNYAADIDYQILNVINPAVTATAWNTYDTLTAVVAFNNNYLTTVSALSATIKNPIIISNTIAISSTSLLPVSGNINILNPTTSLSAYVTNPTTSLSAYIINPQIEITNDIGNPIPVTGSLSATILNPVTAVTILTPTTAYSNIIGSNITLPVSGAVTIANTVTATIVNSVSATITNTSATPVLVKQADTLQVDPLGRLRTAASTNSWWYQAAVDKDGDLRYTEQFTGLSAQSIFVQDIASVTMTPGLSSTGKAIRQTRRYFKYRPGTGHQVFFTLNWSGYQTGVIKRMGQFDESDGMFFELSGSDFNVVVRRRLPDGTILEDRTNSKNFSNDKLDGTGPSGINMFSTPVTAVSLSAYSITPLTQQNDGAVYNVVYDTNGVDVTSLFRRGSKLTMSGASNALYNGVVFVPNTSSTTLTATYIINPGTLPTGRTITATQTPWSMEWTYWMDYIGGRTSRVRFVVASPNQGPILLHTYNTAGTLGTQFVNEPASPLRYEIYNTQAQTDLPVFTLASEAVDVESEVALNPGFGTAYNPSGQAFLKTTGSEYPIIGISLRPGEPYNRGDIQIQDIQLAETGNNGNYQPTPTYYWRLVLNPTIGGSTSTTNIGKTSRSIAYSTTANQISGGITLYSGFFVGGGASINVRTALNFLNLGTNVSMASPDTIVLCAQLIDAGQNNSTLYGGFNFIEAL